MNTRLLLAAASLIVLSGAAGAAPAYTVQDVTFPTDPAFTQLNGINDSGATVGTHGAAVNMGFTRSSGGAFSDLNVPGSASTQVLGVAANGTAAGIFVDQAGTTHGFVTFPGAGGPTFSAYDQPNTAFNQLLGISADASRFAGYSSTDPAGQILQKAYVGNVQAHTFTDVNGLLPVNVNSQATGVNNAGTAVGFYMPTTTTSLGFEDVDGKITTLDPFGSAFTQALGIATDGEVVGFYTDAGGFQHGYIDQNGAFSTFDPAGSLGTTINGVNDQGQVVGFYTDAADDVIGFEATPVAEPGSLAVLGAGLIGLFGVTRRRPA